MDKDLLTLSSSTLAPESIKVNFIGEVNTPGSINIKPNSTLIDGIMAAGGPRSLRSNYNFVEILRINRNGNGFRKRYKLNLVSDYSSEKNPILLEGDSVWVRKNNFTKATDTLGKISTPIKDLVSVWTLFKLVN